jgi:hypothetical protein
MAFRGMRVIIFPSGWHGGNAGVGLGFTGALWYTRVKEDIRKRRDAIG